MIRDSKKLEGVLGSAYELGLLKQSFPGILGGAKAFEFVLVGGQTQVSIERLCSPRGLNNRFNRRRAGAREGSVVKKQSNLDHRSLTFQSP